MRDLPEIGIRSCCKCGLVFLDSHDHIGHDFYQKDFDRETLGSMSWHDYLAVCRDDDQRRARQLRALTKGRRFLDVGCGAGGLLLALTDAGTKASGVEPMLRWREALGAKEFQVFPSIEAVPDQSHDVIGLFHSLEHMPDPISVLKEVRRKIAPGGSLIVEVPSADDALLTLYKSEAFSKFTYWSPHLYLFSPSTLSTVLRHAGFKPTAVEQFQRYPLSNHLHWLAKDSPGGHVAWSFLDSPALCEAYASRLAELAKCDTLIASASVE